MKTEIKISPLTRLSQSLDLEMNIDKDGVLKGLSEKYIDRLAISENKRDSLFRSLFLIDAALAILISGSDLKLPLTELTTSEIPAIIEIVTAISAVTMVFGAVAFINWAAYDAIVRQYAVRHARPSHIDPDFINAAETHIELTLKLLRIRFNVWGVDFHEPGRGFRSYSILVHVLISALFILFPILHYALTYLSFQITIETNGLGLTYIIYIFVVVLCNILAILVFAGSYLNFRFFVDLAEEPASTPKSDSQ